MDLTTAERIIYRQACHEESVYDLEGGYDRVDILVRQRLLYRCAHFDMSDDAQTDSQAVTKLGERLKQKKEDVLEQLRYDSYRALCLGITDDFASQLRGVAHRFPLIESRVIDALGQPQRKLMKALALRNQASDQPALVQPLPPIACYGHAAAVHALTHAIARRTSPKKSQQLRMSPMCPRECVSRGRGALLISADRLPELLDVAQRSENFYYAQLKCMSGDYCMQECAICMVALGSAHRVTLFPCSHFYHTACAYDAVRSGGNCPLCRRVTLSTELSPMDRELEEAEASLKHTDAPMTIAHRKHGSKLNAVAHHLQQIRSSDPTAQAIVYTQWLELERHVERALLDHGVPCVRMTNNATCGSVLSLFQERKGPWVLLLSLSTHSSGLNITAASHVVFVHPMNASSLGQATSYEQQAVGRIRRIGQRLSTVHVWRFVTRCTVEEHIVKLHGQDSRSSREEAAPEDGPVS